MKTYKHLAANVQLSETNTDDTVHPLQQDVNGAAARDGLSDGPGRKRSKQTKPSRLSAEILLLIDNWTLPARLPSSEITQSQRRELHGTD